MGSYPKLEMLLYVPLGEVKRKIPESQHQQWLGQKE
jgi:hypothetical protein